MSIKLKLKKPVGYNPTANRNSTGEINSNVSGEDISREFNYGDLYDSVKKSYIRKIIEEVIKIIKQNSNKNSEQLIKILSSKFNLVEIPADRIEDSLWHMITDGEHLGQAVQGYRIVKDDEGNELRRIPHISFSSDLDYLNGLINRMVKKLELNGMIELKKGNNDNK